MSNRKVIYAQDPVVRRLARRAVVSAFACAVVAALSVKPAWAGDKPAALNSVAGMYVLQFPGQNLAPVTTYIMNQPAVRGGNIVVVWSSVSKGNGVYDWSAVDTQIAAWAAIGKPVKLIVW